MSSLKYRQHQLSSTGSQIAILESSVTDASKDFNQKLKESGLYPLKATGINTFQMNIGKMCNQTCKHCHVDAAPDRKEMMSRDILEQCLKVIRYSGIDRIDITGGAPEMHPDFNRLIEQLASLDKKIMVRCNLTIIESNKKYHYLPQFFKDHNVEVISSLPFYNASRTDRQRGEGVFEKSIAALNRLNAIGYGGQNTGLILNLVYNPGGAFLPSDQTSLEKEFKRELFQNYGIEFNQLFAITNLPISRYLDYLLQSGNYESYMNKLIESYNPVAAANVMCRNTISVSFDGYLYDCDFNQMLEMKVLPSASRHISDFDTTVLNNRTIKVHQHCFGCTAGAGSSCGGTLA